MEKMKKFMAIFASFILSLPFMVAAQDDATYIDNLNVQDSSYMEQDLLAGAETASSSGSNSTTIIIIAAVVIIAIIVFVIMKKKKK
jgi:LPXTG-motif cell wall-anchored protein